MFGFLRLIQQHGSLFFRAPGFFFWQPLVWCGYQLQVARLIWGLELWRYLDSFLPPAIPLTMTMKMTDLYEEPIVKDLVLIGAGHAHVFVLKNFGMKPDPNVRITLITDGIDTPYSGMLPGFVSGLYSREECHLDVLRLAEFAKARVIVCKAKRVNTQDRFVELEGDRPPIPFDVLSMNVGSSPTLPELGRELVVPVKPISHFSIHLERIVDRNLRGLPFRVVVVGGGAGGVEIALALYHRLRAQNSALSLVLVSKSKSLCNSHSNQFQKLVEAHIRSTTDIELLLEHDVKSVQEYNCENGPQQRRLKFSNPVLAAPLFADEVIWCTNASGPKLFKDSEFSELDQSGFVKVKDTLQLFEADHVFAVGDCACFASNPLAKSGVFAVRQGPILTENLRTCLSGQWDGLVSFVPQHSFLGIVGTQNGKLAMASKGNMGVGATAWLWELKEWIDRRWMAGYSSLLPVREFSLHPQKGLGRTANGLSEKGKEELCRLQMKCGGCGSKVGGSLLSRAIRNLDVVSRSEVLLGAGDDCALLKISDQVVATSVDFFRSIWRDEFVFAQICANHALSDVFAMGAQALSATCMVQLPVSPEDKMEQRLSLLMQGAVKQLNASQCALVGGHTTEGAELLMGFSVLGQTRSGHVNMLLKAATVFEPGRDVLILTKGLGTGLIMETHMHLQAKGTWVQASLESMLLSNEHASVVLGEFGASGLTDITGFGLMGHLLEMMGKQTTCAVKLQWEKIPLLPGAKECMALQKVVSSLAMQNERSGVRRMKNAESCPILRLLFDPQTSGGLLAVVSRERASECVRALQQVYHDAAIVGEFARREDGEKHLIEIFNT